MPNTGASGACAYYSTEDDDGEVPESIFTSFIIITVMFGVTLIMIMLWYFHGKKHAENLLKHTEGSSSSA